VIALDPIARLSGSTFPLASIVRRVKLQGVADEALKGVAEQQFAPVQVRDSDPLIRMAGSTGAEQLLKVRVSLFEEQEVTRLDQLHDGTAQTLGRKFKVP
jgi:hypothetical protein